MLCYLDDSTMLWLVQALVVLTTLFLFCLDRFHDYRAGKSGLVAEVTRSDKSMTKYYAVYASANGLLVALVLSVETAEGYRVFLTIINTACCFYIFVMNQYMRNKTIELTGKLTKVESR